MAAICYPVLTKGKQFGPVRLLFYIVEKADMKAWGRIEGSTGDMNDRCKQDGWSQQDSSQNSHHDTWFALERAQSSAKAGLAWAVHTEEGQTQRFTSYCHPEFHSPLGGRESRDGVVTHALSVFWPNCYYLISLSFKILVWPRLLWVWVNRAALGRLRQMAIFLSILVTLVVVRKNTIHVSIFHSCGMTVERGRRRAMIFQHPSAKCFSSLYSGHFNLHNYTYERHLWQTWHAK